MLTNILHMFSNVTCVNYSNYRFKRITMPEYGVSNEGACILS